MVSQSLGYGKNYDDDIPTYIVMVTTGEVRRPAVKYGFVNRNYLLFGVVIVYIYINWETGRADEEWDGVVKNHERLRVQWVKVAGRKHEDWDIVLPSTKWVTVAGKRTDGELIGINPCLKAQLMIFFCTPQGWLPYLRA